MTQPVSLTPAPGAYNESLAAVRPRLRHDVVFAQTQDGVLLRDSDNGFVVKGKSAYPLASLMLPYLTGEHTVEDLCADLPEGHRAMVASMISTLLDRGLVRDAQPLQGTGLDERLRTRFSPQLNFLDHYAAGAEARFTAFRSTRVLIAGTGETAVAAGVSLLRNGLSELHVMSAGSPVAAELGNTPAELAAEAGAATVRGVLGNPAELTATDLAAYDVVLLTAGFGGDLPLGRLLPLLSNPQPGGPVLLPAFAIGQLAVVGPQVRSGASPCWVCALLRLDRNIEPSTLSALWRAASLPGLVAASPQLCSPVARMIGTMLAFDVFRLRTGAMPAETDGAIVVQDLHTIEATREEILPHPHCPFCRSALKPRDADQVVKDDPDELVALRQKVLYGRYSGIASAFTEGSLPQTPVRVAGLRIGLPGGATRDILAFDLHTTADARGRALDAVAVTYAETEAIQHGARSTNGTRVVPAPSLLTWAGIEAAGDSAADASQLVPATSLADGDGLRVPAAAVYPFSALNAQGVFERSAAGTGAGHTTAQAQRAGLLSAIGYLALRAAISGDTSARRLEPSTWGDDRELGFLLDALNAIGHSAAVFELRVPDMEGAAASVAVVVAVADLGGTGQDGSGLDGAASAGAERPAWTLGTGHSVRDAAASAVRDLVGLLQVGNQDGGTQAADTGLELLPDFDPRTILMSVMTGDEPESKPGQPGQPGAATEKIAQSLLGTGYQALAVDTTPPDLRSTGLFATCRVLLRRTSR